MRLTPAVSTNQLVLLALVSLGQRAAKELGVPADASMSALARGAGSSRTYIYEVASRFLDAIEQVASRAPGRPRSEPSEEQGPPVRGMVLENQTLRFRLERPDACIRTKAGRQEYSARFRRFVLERHDEWDGPLGEFSRHVDVPLDTLRDWLEADRNGLAPAIPDPKPPASVPVDATDLVRQIATLFAAWEGTTKAFIRHAASLFLLYPGQVARVLRILGCIRPYRRSSSRFRYRGSTENLAPGSVLVSDGTVIGVAVIGQDSIVEVNWQGTVDQATGCHTAFVVTDQESADSLWEAHQRSCDFLGRAPLALLHDNKPCYDPCQDPTSIDRLFFQPTELIAATLERPENKAIVEGAFGLFQQQVGDLLLIDATSPQALARSVVAEATRAWAAGRDHSPHPDFHGMSRRQVLAEFCPSPEQIERDRAFLRRLKARHEKARRPHLYEESRLLLDHAFSKWGILEKDPRGRLRTFLSAFCPEAIRRALALVAAKLRRGAIDREFLHRYLAKVVQSTQDELDLEVAEQELLDLCRLQATNLTRDAQVDLAVLREQSLSPLELARAIAERAAHGALPVESRFWTEVLVDHLRQHLDLSPAVRRFLVRLYDAPVHRRFSLLDTLAVLEIGLL